MSFSGRVIFFLLWALSLLVIGGLVSAQTPQASRDQGEIISGADIGFKPEGWQGNARTGRLMVRIDGKWVEAKDVITVVRTTK